MQNTGKIILIVGIIIACIGVVIWLFGDKLNWVGNLPGDIKIKREHFSFYMPLTTMILLSIAISVIVWLFRNFFS